MGTLPNHPEPAARRRRAQTAATPTSRVLPEPVRPGYVDCYSAQFTGPGPQGIEAYAQVIRPSFDFALPDGAEATTFSARAEVCFLPDIVVSRASSTASRMSRTTETVAARGTDQVLVVCYRSGYFDLTAAGRTQRVLPGELAVIDLMQEVTIEAPLVDNVGLAIARPQLEKYVPSVHRAHGFVRPDDALSRLLRANMETIIANAATMTLADARGVSDATLQLVAACLQPLSRQLAETGSITTSLAAIRAYVEERLLEPELSQQTLLDVFGITRSTLYRLFEPLGGVAGYIARRRLDYAFRQLSDTRRPPEPVSKLAARLGYTHPSAFTRAFKDAFGLSPRQVQSLRDTARDQEFPLLTSNEPMQYFRPLEPS
jgi:AraC-like DNA-binding protein